MAINQGLDENIDSLNMIGCLIWMLIYKGI